jgi:hypothetical protein
MLRCLARSRGLRERLKREGIDLAEFEKCLGACCRGSASQGGEGAPVRRATDIRTALADLKLRSAVLELMREIEEE